MSLFCVETNLDIEYGDALFSATRRDIVTHTAVSKPIIDRIPMSERCEFLREAGDYGVDIHIATSGRNFNGSYTLCDFELGKFLFSISKEAAEKYLPKYSKMRAGK